MKGALIILFVLMAVGVVLYIGELKYRKRERKNGEGNYMEDDDIGVDNKDDIKEGDKEEEGCCGMHLVCEKDSLSPMSGEIVYYDDEELDRFFGRSGNDYTAEEVEEFREILMTLRPEDVSGWARSVTARRLELPSDVRDELLMLVNEQRSKI